MKWTPKDIINLVIAITALLGMVLGFIQGQQTKASLKVTDRTLSSVAEAAAER